MSILSRYPELNQSLPQSFLQHKAPKIRQDNLEPVDWPQDPELTWCPPGHGDIYTALVTSGALQALLDKGYKFAFVSNADNLGAVVDLAILGYFVENELPFLMEVAHRTGMDRKGGHLAQRRADGRLILREAAQCPPQDQADFQNIHRHRYFNTNNLWFNLSALDSLMKAKDYRLGLPLIRNAKTVDPRDLDSTPVYQLETAMGSAIAVFDGAQAVLVSRCRFAPVKTTNDLLAVRSDAYTLTDDFRVIPSNGRDQAQVEIELDERFYKFVSDFDARFSHGIPSLEHTTSLVIEGDFCFGRNIVCRGDVRLKNETNKQIMIADGKVLTGTNHYS